MIVVVVWGNCGGVFGDCGDGDDSCDISTTTKKQLVLSTFVNQVGKIFTRLNNIFIPGGDKYFNLIIFSWSKKLYSLKI